LAQKTVNGVPYHHLFFDLDHTLWDFARNSREALLEIYQEWGLAEQLGVDAERFLVVYQEENDQLWSEYRAGRMDKATLRVERFARSLSRLGAPDGGLARQFDEAYLTRAPLKTALIPGTITLLNHLQGRYRLHILTNGFEETQHRKLKETGLASYFEEVVTSDQVKAHKPAARLFVTALRRAGATRRESLMIGDSWEADVLGARGAGMAQAYFNPAGAPISDRFRPTYELRQLVDLAQHL
jgi:putative hydrolase of the HAD superfamily